MVNGRYVMCKEGSPIQSRSRRHLIDYNSFFLYEKLLQPGQLITQSEHEDLIWNP